MTYEEFRGCMEQYCSKPGASLACLFSTGLPTSPCPPPELTSHYERSQTVHLTVILLVSCRKEGTSASAECQLTKVPSALAFSGQAKSLATTVPSHCEKSKMVHTTISPPVPCGDKSISASAECLRSEVLHASTFSGPAKSMVHTHSSRSERSNTVQATVSPPIPCGEKGVSASTERQLTDVPCASTFPGAVKSPAPISSFHSERSVAVPATTPPPVPSGEKRVQVRVGCQLTEHPRNLTFKFSRSNCPVVLSTVPRQPALPVCPELTRTTCPMSIPGQVNGSLAPVDCQLAEAPTRTSVIPEPLKAPTITPGSGSVPDLIIHTLPHSQLPFPESEGESESLEDDITLAVPASAVFLLPSRNTGLHHLRSAEIADQLPSLMKGDRDLKDRIKS
ncbi:uncharacterized protein EI90DRAFT_3121157 [Cantharellus anzutake]|uniref:uncharacterized protein n=1 Tax=Cantharellus anzutake TaxID=1750568 RepID=UPI001908A01B|nr:uncharacterized protein EI90DRAFT_3121157 [Cantharellus anzutake]KAF8334717.1 hypothetical protein EI90DRAFT_3121157 [Cantharellus anzutake]